jgi:glycosyltransferase involved in cell wall biosynthesis
VPTTASVVVPTHNRAALIPFTLRSVLWQQDIDLEVIVVDDGSTDGTAGLVSVMSDERVRWIKNETSRGVSAARNQGAALARGTWLAFLDDDDLWAPDKLAAQIRAAVDSGTEWAYAGIVNITLEGRICGGAPPPSPDTLLQALPSTNVVPAGASNVVVRRRSFEATGGFDLRLRHAADWDMWLAFAGRGSPACVGRPLVAYRLHPDSASLDVGGMLEEIALFEDKHGTRVDRARFYRHLAHLSLRRGKRSDALRHTVAAVTAGGYSVSDLSDDRRIFTAHARETLHRKWPGLIVERAGRHARASARDPNRAWKTDAQEWVDRLQPR